jgi:hypothetical protein
MWEARMIIDRMCWMWPLGDMRSEENVGQNSQTVVVAALREGDTYFLINLYAFHNCCLGGVNTHSTVC